MKDKQFVAMTHETCPICGKNTNEGIVIHKGFGDLSEVHNKSTGFSNPCDECQKGLDMGAIMVIVVDKDKSGDCSSEQLYRTGNIMGLSQDWAKRAINDETLLADILKKQVMIMDYKDAIAIGLPVKYEPIN